MRILFFGTSEFAVPSLEQLVTAHNTVVMCVTQPDRPQGRGRRLEASPVKRAAARLGVPLMQPERLERRLFEGLEADVGVVVAFGKLLRRDLLALPSHGLIGVHPSLLPAYRGAAPIHRALLNGETTTGVTVFQLNEALDAGAILSQQAVAIEPEEDAQTLSERLARLVAAQLARVLEAVAAGQANPVSQDESRATMAPKLTKTDGQIDWAAPAAAICRLVRATVSWPGAATTWRGRSLKVWAASVAGAAADSSGEAPGTVVRIHRDGIDVATGRGLLSMTDVQPADRRRMRAQEFLAGHPVHVGEILGGGTWKVESGK